MESFFVELDGYYAQITLADSKDHLIGVIINIDDEVSFESDSGEELMDDFESALDAYFKECERLGVDPDEPKEVEFEEG